MQIQYTFTTIPLVLVTILLLSLAYYARDKRHIPGAKIFILLMFDLALWALTHLGEWIFVDPAIKLLCLQARYFFIATVPILWLLFTVETTGRGQFVRRRNILLLLIVPAINYIGVWTNEWHGFFWRDITQGFIGSVTVLETVYGPWFWIHATYSYLVLLAGTVVLLQAYQRSVSLYRSRLRLLLIGSFAPWVANAITISEVIPTWEALDLTPFGFFLTGLVMAWSLSRYHLLDIIPVARDIIFERMGEGVIVMNTNRHVVDVNPAAEQITGLTAVDLMGQPAEEIFSDWFEFVEVPPEGVSTQNEISIKNAAGECYFMVSTSPLRGHSESYTGWVMVLQDITDRKQMEQAITLARDEAITASNLKTRLLANVSHDLRTPLGSILGYTEILQAGVQGEVNPGQYDTLTNIIDSTEQLLTFVNNLIGQAQLESGKLRLNNQEIKPDDLLSDFQSTANALARAKGLRLELSIDSKMPPVIVGDPYWLRQIIINLVSNAVKFTAQGKVSVEIMAAGYDHWTIKVTDTGEGITPEYHDQIFEPFEQAETKVLDHSQPHGSGLGLSIVRQLTELMGGRVELESLPGKGSTFTVRLPWSVQQGALQ
jgi:PAS domain S-box-containing protein